MQVQASVLASDRHTDGDVLAMNGASAALCVSELPFNGPIGSVRLAQVDGVFVPFPTQDQLEESDLDLIVSGSEDTVLMIEGFAREMPEDRMLEAIDECQRIIRELCLMQKELMEKGGKAKKEYDIPDFKPLQERIYAAYLAEMKQIKAIEGKLERNEASKKLKQQDKAELIPDPEAEGAVCESHFSHVWHDLEEKAVRELILEGRRPDGRDSTSLRPISCEVDLLPRVHGSALFQR